MIGRWTSRLSEPERELVALCRDFAQKRDRHPRPAGLGGGPVPDRSAAARWASSVCSACSSPRSGAGSACRPSASWLPWSRSVWPTSPWPRPGRRTSPSARCRCSCSATTPSASRWLRPLAEGRALGAFGLTEPGRRIRRPRHPHPGRAARRRLADQRAQDVHLQRRDRPVLRGHAAGPHRVAATTPQPGIASLVVEKDTPGVHHGSQDAGHRLAGARHPRALLRRRVGARRPPGG